MASREVYRIEIPIEVEDKYSSEIDKASRKVSSFEKEIEKTQSRVERMNRKRWEMTLRAKDYASRVIRNVSMFAQRVTRRAYRITVRALDYATRPLRSIVGSISSILATAGIVGGVAGGLVLPLKMTIERQNVTTAFEVLLGSQEKAQKRIAELTEFAGNTPYARDEIYEASRVLEVFTKGALSTGEGLRLVGDVAAGTQQPFSDVALWMGRLYDAMAAGRPVGEMTSRLQEMGAISGDARARIEKLAKSGANIKTTWPRVTKEFERFDGMMGKMSKNLSNLLLGVKTFYQNNVSLRWGQGIEKVLSPALEKFKQWRKENEKGIQAMGDAIERYGEKFTRFFVDRASKGASYINELFFSDKYKDLSFSAKVRIMIDDTKNYFSEWWEKTGREQVTGLSGRMGSTFGDMIKSAVLTALGVGAKGEGDNTFASAGYEAGSTFVTKFLEALDAGNLAWEITKKIGEINIKGATDPFKGEGFGSTAGALIVDALVLGAAAKVLRPFKRLGQGGKWVWDKTFGRKKGKDVGGAGTRTADTRRDAGNRKVNTRVERNARKFKLPKFRIPKDAMKRVAGPLGTLWTLDWLDSSIDKGWDWLFGHKKGDIKSKGLFSNPFSSLERHTDSRQGAISKLFGSKEKKPLIGSSSLTPAGTAGVNQGSSIQPFIQDNVYQPLHQAVSNATAFGQAFAGNFVSGINQASVTSFEWIQQQLYHPTLQAVGNATLFGQAYSQNFVIGMNQIGVDIHSWLSSNLYQPTLQAVGNSTMFGQAYAKNFEYGLLSTPIEIHSWISESLYQPILQAVGNATIFGSAFVGNFIVGLRSRKAEVVAEARSIAQAAESGLRSPATPVSKKVTDNWAVGTKYAKYADGGYINHPHFGLIGEAGPEMIIPLSSGRRSRALELFARTGEMLGVRPYANGGMVGKASIVPSGDTPERSARVIVQNDINVSPTVIVQGANTDDHDSLAEKIADKVAGIVADKVEITASNMPVT